MKKYLFLIACSFLMAACSVKPPSIVLQPPIKIETDDDHHDHDYDDDHRHKKGFCPPGQAKKGNC